MNYPLNCFGWTYYPLPGLILMAPDLSHTLPGVGMLISPRGQRICWLVESDGWQRNWGWSLN